MSAKLRSVHHIEVIPMTFHAPGATSLASVTRLLSGRRYHDAQLVFVGGTAAVKPFAVLYYWLAMRLSGCSHLYALPRGGLSSLPRTYAKFEDWAERNLDPDRPTILVGHSQGGLIAAMYTSNHPEVKLVVAISAPFDGTVMAWLISFLQAGRDMTPGSSFIAEVQAILPHIADKLVTISAGHELLVIPRRSTQVDGARNLALPGGHITEIIRGELPRMLKAEIHQLHLVRPSHHAAA